MKRFFLMVTTVGLMAPAGLYTQEVYKNASDQVILDLTVAAGMPADAVTDVSKTEIYRDFVPSATVLGTDNGRNGSINERVFQKLEVAKHDLNGNGTTGTTGTRTFTWVNAFNYCKAIGEGWRLPTYRELLLICIFRSAWKSIFDSVNGSDFTSNSLVYYWSATEFDASSSYAFCFYETGEAWYEGKSLSSSRRARCVREVVD
jgi:hypothetical protein